MGDYYVGEQHICTQCDHWFYLPNEPRVSKELSDLSVLRQIKSGVTDAPTTKRGN